MGMGVVRTPKSARDSAQHAARRIARYARTPTGRDTLWFLVYALQMILALLMLSRLAMILLGTGETAEKFSNTFCEERDPRLVLNKTAGPVISGEYAAPCALEYNFKKAIFVWLDGVSFDTAGPVFETFPDTNVFKIKHRENPWSGWVFATIMTGKPNRNMGVIKNDNLFYQFAKSGMPIELGVQETMAYVGYGLHEFVEKNMGIEFAPNVHNDDDSSPPQMYDWFFKCGSKPSVEECVNSTLDSLNEQEKSIFLESFYLDHQVHYAGFTKYSEGITELLYRTMANLQYIKNWVNDHPDYMMVIISDHGQKTTPSESGIHGNFLTVGNEGWIMFYNPLITPVISTPSTPYVLNTVDVLPTIWQFFSANGVSIPAENIGVGIPITTSSRTSYKAVKTNAQQIIRYAEKVKMDVNMQQYQAATACDQGGTCEDSYMKMLYFASELSSNLLEAYLDIRPAFPAVLAVAMMTLSVAIQVGLSREGFKVGTKYLGIGMVLSAYLGWICIATLFEHPNSPNELQAIIYAVVAFAFFASYLSHRLPPAISTPHSHKRLGGEIEGEGEQIELKNSQNIIGESYCDSHQKEEAEKLSPMPFNEVETQKITWRESLISKLKYIFGMYKEELDAPEAGIFWFFVTFVCLTCSYTAYYNKMFFSDDIQYMKNHPLFWKTLGIFVVFMEFRWQRIMLCTKLQLTSEQTQRFGWQLLHPSFLPLNLKSIAYFAIVGVSMQSTLSHNLAFFLYAILFIHAGFLLICTPHIQRDLPIPIFALLFLLSVPEERIILSFYYFTIHFLSKTLEKKIHNNQYLLPPLLLSMVMLSHFYFAVMGRAQYQISNMSVMVAGIEDPTKYPNFSVMLMGIHYFGIFFLVVGFIVRLTNPTPALRPLLLRGITIGHTAITCRTSNHLLRKLTTSVLLFFAATCVAFFYFFVKIRSFSDACMIFAGATVAMCVVYLLTVLGSEMAMFIVHSSSKFLPSTLLSSSTSSGNFRKYSFFGGESEESEESGEREEVGSNTGGGYATLSVTVS